MDYRIETKEAFQVFGIEGIFKTDGSGDYPNTPHELWNQNHANGAYEKLALDAGDLPAFVGRDLCKVHAVCDYKKTESDTFAYMQCAFMSGKSRAEGYSIIDIPAYTWVIFPSERFKWDMCGKVIDALYKRFYSEWLPTAEYERVDNMNFEVYGGDTNMGYIELWYAVKKKS